MVNMIRQLGRDALFCVNAFKMKVCDIVSEMRVRCAVERYCERKVVEQQMQMAGFLREPTVATKASSVARSLKLSNVDLGQYLDGRSTGKTERCEPVSVRRCGP